MFLGFFFCPLIRQEHTSIHKVSPPSCWRWWNTHTHTHTRYSASRLHSSTRCPRRLRQANGHRHKWQHTPDPPNVPVVVQMHASYRDKCPPITSCICADTCCDVRRSASLNQATGTWQQSSAQQLSGRIAACCGTSYVFVWTRGHTCPISRDILTQWCLHGLGTWIYEVAG